MQADSVIYVEKTERFKGAYFASFDTLVYKKGKFKGTDFRIKNRRGELFFYPGNIHLIKAYPPDSLYKTRNIAYLNSYGHQIHKLTQWAGIRSWTIVSQLESDSVLLSANPDTSYKIIDQRVQFSIDTVLQHYPQHIDSIVIARDKIRAKKKKQITVYEREKMEQIWSHLKLVDSIHDDQTEGLLFALQFFPTYVVYGMYHPIFFLITLPAYLTAEGLIMAENFIRDRIQSNHTYLLHIYTKSGIQKIKIRKNKILTPNGYIYYLHDQITPLLK